MSGVTGTPQIKSRSRFREILTSYTTILKDFPDFIDVQPSGSYNSDATKTSFGDMDLVVTLKGKDKKVVKKKLQAYLKSTNQTLPFVSPKYKGRMSYNSGEIVTINYQNAQVDNIIALDKTEAKFKVEFLNLPAEKQGLLLGIMKTAFIEQGYIGTDTEFEYNLSSKELQLREVTYIPGTKKEQSRTVLKTWTTWIKVDEILNTVNIDLYVPFEDILTQLQAFTPRSRERIKGVFKSMVSVKSGEVGKPKGQRKEYCIKKVNEL